MTMNSTTPAAEYTGDGTSTAFNVPFQFFGASEIEVIERTISSGAETTKTLTTHYSVSGGNGSTGTVTAVSAPASTVEWHIRRKTAQTQGTDYAEGDGVPSAVLELDLDRAVALIQELIRDSARAVRLKSTAAAVTLQFDPAANVGKFFKLDDNGNLTFAESTAGDQGPQGDAGEQGPAGADGARWYDGATDPSAGTGANTDYYLQTADDSSGEKGDVWSKSGGSWSIIGNILGPQGDQGIQGDAGEAGAAGADGAVWYIGATDPDNGNGADGDFYLQTGTGATGVLGDVWVKASGSWSIETNIRGATGASGMGSGDLVSTNNLNDLDDIPTARGNLGLAALAVLSTVATAQIDDAAVTYAKIANGTGLSVLGRAANSAGVNADIVAGTDGYVLLRSGTSLVFGRVVNAGLADMAEATLKGRASGAGTGVATDLTLAQAVAILEASVAQWRGNTSGHLLSTDKVWSAMAEVTLTDGATVNWDMNSGFDFSLTLGGNRTLANPTNTKVGQKGRLRVVQDGTGSRTITWGTSYEFAGGVAPVLSTAAAAEDVLYYDVISSTRILVVLSAAALA